jgi:hypothetical protein
LLLLLVVVGCFVSSFTFYVVLLLFVGGRWASDGE